MDVTVVTELDSDELPDDYKTCIYRVVQEALHNCARHSHATSVRITVQEVQHRLILSIRDNGQGFDVQHTKGLGLLGIQERVTRLGGICHVHSQPGIGTTLSVELPVASVDLPSKDAPQGNVKENVGENRSARIHETDSHPVG